MDKLINNFRKCVNDSTYVLEAYKNVNDKNKWSCICSCMDWIDVSIEYIKLNKERIEKKSYFDLEIFAYISSIDLVSEAVQQLYRVFYNKTDSPFKNDYSIFEDLNKTDDDYFSHVRAIFGAHPTNIKKNLNERNFASYPSNNFTDSGFSVILYTNKLDEWGDIFYLSFKKLEQYFEKRYNFLNELIKKIESDKDSYIKVLQNQKIEKKECIIQQLEILKRESKKRFNLDYYNCVIDTLLELLKFKITEFSNVSIIKRYIDILIPYLDKLYNDLQTINFEEIDEDILSSQSFYHYTKILENNFIPYDIIEVKELLKDFVNIHLKMNYSEIKSLCQIGMYFLYQKNKSLKNKVPTIDIDELLLEIQSI